jgi:excisionase family DNA binding protein
MLGVTPDTVLKWIKRGKLVAMRTAGGHFRIPREQLDCLLEARSSQKAKSGTVCCWEYFATDGHLSTECPDCLVYKSRATRCFELVQIPKQSGFHGCFHYKGDCRSCPYYNEQLQAPVKVLVVSDSMDLRQRLLAQASRTRFKLEFAAHGYDCSAQVERFRPEMVVIDCALSAAVVAGLCMHLVSDPRVPGIKVVLAQARAGRSVDRAPGVVGELRHPFELTELERFVDMAPEAEQEAEAEPAVH